MSLQISETSADYTGLISDTVFQEWLRFDGSDQDNIKTIIIEGAIREAEAFCQRTFGDKTLVVLYDCIERYKKYYLPLAPVRSVSEVLKIDADGTETTLVNGTDYYIQGITGKWITFVKKNYTTSGSTVPPTYKITYTAGNADPSTVPNDIKRLILHDVAEHFENREENIIDGSATILQNNSKKLLQKYRTRVL
jgi:uncharacterized phiE125 gp8 family phage protein